ncbi:unnamed protein product [Mytilus coruscus]|uniref:Uncharacterized protein n=1 Tax=Mytilus coruscus TaxID=42192 RepID=A0A6J8BL32_MYTCO|nr:unnamed protein product [Mytilus coruscus]
MGFNDSNYEFVTSTYGRHHEPLEPISVNIDNVLPDDKLQGTEGLDLIITCRADGGKPPPNVKLKISGSTVAIGNQSLQHTLSTISRSYDRTTITCYAGHEEISHYPLIDSAKLYLFLKPMPPIFAQRFVITEETVPLNVSCTSLGSRPAANFTWLIGKNNFDVTSNSYESRTFNSSTETFTVTSTLSYKFHRTYTGQMLTCKASNIISSNVSSSTLLNIKYAPSVGVENQTFQQRDTVRNVQCSIQGNPSEYTYINCSHKSFYGVTIRELPIGQNGILTLPEVPMEFVYQDSGIYVCTVGNGILGTNGQEKQTGYGFVRIKAQPVFLKSNVKKMTGMIGKSVNVNIYVFSEPKYTFIKWYRNTTPLSQSAKFSMLEKIMIVDDDFHDKGVQLDGYKLTLVINAFRIEDATFYRLLLSNGIGDLVEHFMFLEIGNIPQTPTNITVVSVGETRLTIQWVPVDEDFHLIYHIEHKLSISSTWIRNEINVRDIEIGNTKLLYTLVGLQISTYYDVRILAENSFNKSLPSAIITVQTLSKANALQSASIPMVALGTSSTIITIVAWLVLGLFWFKRKTTTKTKRNKTDSTQHRSDIQMYDVVIDSARTQIDQPKDMSDTSMAAYEALGLKDKPNLYTLSHGLSSLKGSTVQLECPETVTESRTFNWHFRSGSHPIIYSQNSVINPSLQTDLHKRINITGNHTIVEYHLSIYELKESYDGRYECVVTGNAIVDRQQLTVIVDPSSVDIDNVLEDNKLQGTEGLVLLITCRAVGGKLQPDLKLTIAGSTVATDKQSLQYTLLKISRSYDRKTITCYAGNEEISRYQLVDSAKLYLTYAPSVGVENKILLQTDKVRNVQGIIQGNPSKYTYFKCHHKSYYDVMIREFTIGHNGMLALPKVSTEFVYQDSGIYTYTVGNGILGTDGQEKQSGYGFVKINGEPILSLI